MTTLSTPDNLFNMLDQPYDHIQMDIHNNGTYDLEHQLTEITLEQVPLTPSFWLESFLACGIDDWDSSSVQPNDHTQMDTHNNGMTPNTICDISSGQPGDHTQMDVHNNQTYDEKYQTEGKAAIILRHWYRLRLTSNPSSMRSRYLLDCTACKEEFPIFLDHFAKHFKSESCSRRRWQQITHIEGLGCPQDIITYLKNLTSETSDDLIMDLLLKLDVINAVNLGVTALASLLGPYVSGQWSSSSGQPEDHTEIDAQNNGMLPISTSWDLSLGQPDDRDWPESIPSPMTTLYQDIWSGQLDDHWIPTTITMYQDISSGQPDDHRQIDAHNATYVNQLTVPSCLVSPVAKILHDWYQLYYLPHGRSRIACMNCKEDFPIYGNQFIEHFKSNSCSEHRWQQITHLEGLGYPEEIISSLKECTLTTVNDNIIYFLLTYQDISSAQPDDHTQIDAHNSEAYDAKYPLPLPYLVASISNSLRDWYKLYYPPHGRPRIACMGCKEDFPVYGNEFIDHFRSISCSEHRRLNIMQLEGSGWPEGFISSLKEWTVTTVQEDFIYLLLRLDVLRDTAT